MAAGNLLEFNSEVDVGSTFWKPGDEVPIAVLKREPMMFNASSSFAYNNGGPLTRAFLDTLFEELEYEDDQIVVDSRVHMLMKGWYPCIPGWHHDDVPRSLHTGQPDYDNPAYKASHCMGLLNGWVAPTLFARGKTSVPRPPEDRAMYGFWHNIIDDQVKAGQLSLWTAQSNKLIYFDWQTWHRGVHAYEDGWRFFIRASWNTGRKPTNEVREQVQVYLPAVNAGW